MSNGDQRDQSKAIAFKLRPETVRELVQRLAQESENVKWSVHALERMNERGITDKVALEVLRFGDVKGAVEAGKCPGEWKVKMVRTVKGRREAGVVVLTIRNAHLLVKTVEWEDLR